MGWIDWIFDSMQDQDDGPRGKRRVKKNKIGVFVSQLHNQDQDDQPRSKNIFKNSNVFNQDMSENIWKT